MDASDEVPSLFEDHVDVINDIVLSWSTFSPSSTCSGFLHLSSSISSEDGDGDDDDDEKLLVEVVRGEECLMMGRLFLMVLKLLIASSAKNLQNIIKKGWNILINKYGISFGQHLHSSFKLHVWLRR